MPTQLPPLIIEGNGGKMCRQKPHGISQVQQVCQLPLQGQLGCSAQLSPRILYPSLFQAQRRRNLGLPGSEQAGCEVLLWGVL